MRARSSALLIVVAASLSFACASAGQRRSDILQLTTDVKSPSVIPGSWERVEALPPGSPLVVTLKNRERLDGAFNALRPAVLSLTDPSGRAFTVPMSDIGRIEVRAHDSLANGALIGAGIGLGAALAILAVAGSGDGYVLPSAKWGAPLLLSSAAGVAGALIDRAHKSQVIYVAPLEATRQGVGRMMVSTK